MGTFQNGSLTHHRLKVPEVYRPKSYDRTDLHAELTGRHVEKATWGVASDMAVLLSSSLHRSSHIIRI